jgi:hypothetical protein
MHMHLISFKSQTMQVDEETDRPTDPSSAKSIHAELVCLAAADTCLCCFVVLSETMQVDEETDRPTDPPIITSVEVLWNPFEDIVPRTTAAERRAQEQFK